MIQISSDSINHDLPGGATCTFYRDLFFANIYQIPIFLFVWWTLENHREPIFDPNPMIQNPRCLQVHKLVYEHFS